LLRATASRRLYTLSLHDALPIFGGSQGDGQDGVGAELGFVLGTVEVDHRAVEGLLVQRAFAQQQVTDRAVDVGHGLQNAFAQVTDRKSTRLNSSHVKISYAVFCL